MINFVNAFLSYLMLLLIIVALSGVAVFVGITLRKKKDTKNEMTENSNKEE